MDIVFDKSKELDTEIANTVQKINLLVSEDSLIIPVFTDMHLNNTQGTSFRLLLQSLKSLHSQTPFHAVISLGDNLSMLGRDTHASNEMIAELLEDILNQISDAAQVPCYYINGNHDGIGTDFFTEDFWAAVVNDKYDCGMAKRNENSAYFYVDYDKSGVRLIFLSMPCGSDLDAAYPTPLWKFGDTQLKWLEETALSTAGDRDIVIFSHVPIYYSHIGDPSLTLKVWDGHKETASYIEDLYGRAEDQEEIENILLSYSARNPHSRIAACIYGHTHADSFLAPLETAELKQHNLPYYQVEISCLDTKRNKTLYTDTSLGIAFDILVLTPSEKKLTMVRFGDGKDREIRY